MKKISRQSAAGLLLLTLLAANPLHGFAQGVIGSDSTVGVNLNSTFNVPTNKVTVNPGVTIDTTTGGINAIAGNTHTWGVTNNGGTINGTKNNGVDLNAGGSVDNINGGVIVATSAGVDIRGSSGSVVNGGTIVGTNSYGVSLENGGSVNNSGSIHSVNDDAVGISGGTGSVINSGTINSENSDGVDLYNGGTVNNLATGTIEGGSGNGVYITGGAGYVTNAGNIYGDDDNSAVYMNHGGSVNNSSNIIGDYNGVYISGGAGSVDNSGTITGNNNNGVEMQSGGDVVNHTGGSITGVDGNGVYITGGTGSVVNDGYIYGNSNDGVDMQHGGSVVNQVNGTIEGGDGYGVYITGGNGSVDNSGKIYGDSNDGVHLNAGGSVNNQSTGIIEGKDGNGVYISGSTGYVTNSGSIIGDTSDGVYLGHGGTVNNQTGGIIQGKDGNGVYIGGGVGTVINDGTISGSSFADPDGVHFNNGGSVNNLSNGQINGQDNGVYITGGAGTVANAGLIQGTNNDGVYLNNGGSVSQTGGSAAIIGNQYGVEVTGGAGYVTNSGGTITGDNHDGVRLRDGGTVDNELGIIYGNTGGVKITGGVGNVINTGVIWGDNRDGVYLGNGGSVIQSSDNSFINTPFGILVGFPVTNTAIIGAEYGVEITGGAGYVSNDGGIIGTANIYSGHDGVRMRDGGTVDNGTNGTIYGWTGGVKITGGLGAVNNSGLIWGITRDGVYLGNGGSVNQSGASLDTNRLAGLIGQSFLYGASNATIAGVYGVEITGGAGFVTNAGNIYGYEFPYGGGHDGVRLRDGGVVDNEAGGVIYGYTGGIKISGSEGTVVNHGTIIGQTKNGVDLEAGGSVYQSGANASITGAWNGVRIVNGPGTVYNYDGGITGNDGDGVYLGAGGSVDNDSGFSPGTIWGSQYGVEITGYTGFVTNSGTIHGENRDGVRLRAGGTVINEFGGIIEGQDHGVHISGDSGHVVNAGQINSLDGTSIYFDDYNNTLTLQTGSSLGGDVHGGSATDALTLQGTGGEDNNFYNFETLTVQADPWDGYHNGWNLTGTNTFTTGTTVESGLLRINGELTTPLLEVVDSTGGVGGAGTIFGIVDNHGFFAPGNSISNLTIIGSATNYGTYFAQVDNAGNSDHISVSDTFTIISGGVEVQPDRQIYGASTTYNILTASNGVFGAFAPTNLVPQFYPYLSLFLTASLQYPDPTNVNLTLTRAPFVSLAKTFNQKAVAKTLDAVEDSAMLGSNPGMSNLVLEAFWLGSPQAYLQALDSLSGEIHGTIGLVEVQQQRLFTDLIARRMQGIRAGTAGGEFAAERRPTQMATLNSEMPASGNSDPSKPWGVWLQGFGMFGTLNSDGNAAGGDFNISGLSGGLEYQLNSKLVLGLSGGYSSSDVTVAARQSKGNADSFQFAGYGNYSSGNWYLDGVFGYGHNSTSAKRMISVGSISELTKSSYDGDVISVSAEGGYTIHCCSRVELQPLVGLKFVSLSQDSFKEKGLASDGHDYGLNVKSVDMDSLRSSLGARLAATLGKQDGVKFIPEASVRWEHEFMDLGADVTSSFINDSQHVSMVTRGVRMEADSAVVNAGLTVAFNKAIRAFAGYDGTFNANLSSHTFSGGMSFSW